MVENKEPIRVLHIISKLQHGGIETWLMHIFRNSDPARLQHEVLLERPEPGVYDDEAEALGVILHRPSARLNRIAYLKALDETLSQKRYDVVHSHAYMFSGLMLAAAKRRRVPIRLAHAHQALVTQGSANVWQQAKHAVLKWMMVQSATRLIGISEDAIREVAGKDWRSNPKARILIYGFDFRAFSDAAPRAAAIRKRLGISPGQKVIGHVGRFVRQKYHELAIDIFASVASSDPSARLVLVGEGPLEPEVRSQVDRLGLTNKVIFAGTTTDVAAYMTAFDLFLLPSRHEGLGIVVLEAEAGGTPSLVSEVVPPEVDVLPDLVERASLSDTPEHWAKMINRRLSDGRPRDAQSWRKLNSSVFGIQRCVKDLEDLYRGAA